MFETIKMCKDVGFALAESFWKDKRGQAGLNIVALVGFVVFLIVLGKLAPQMYSGLNETKAEAAKYGDTASEGIVMLIAMFFIIGIVIKALNLI